MLARSSIRFRLTAWYALSLGLLLGLLAVTSYFVMRTSIYRAVDVDLRYRLASVIDELHEMPSGTTIAALPSELAKADLLDVMFQVFDDKGTMIYQSDQLAIHEIKPAAPSLDGSAIGFRDAGHSGWRVRCAAQRVPFAGRTITVEVAQPLRFYRASLRAFSTSLEIALPLLVVITTLVGYWLSGRALAPVNQIVKDARSIDSTSLSRRVSVPPAQDELRLLAETLNSMLDRIESSVNRIKQFTDDASHELRTPLTLIQAAAEYSLRRERTNTELVDALEKILRESKRTSQLIDNLLLLARADSGKEVIAQEPVALNTVLREAVERASQLASAKNIKLASEIGDAPVTVTGDSALLQRLFLILIDNAIKYTPDKGAVTVSLQSNGDCAQVQVADTGIGISAEDLPHVFDRFWRADKVRSRDMGGTGLGLSIAKWIVEKSGGTIQVESVIGQGSKFEVKLPKSSNL